jgi:hypothetical protein
LGPAPGSAQYNDFAAVNSTLETLFESAKETLHVRLPGGALPEFSHLEDTIAAWNVTAAREAAWVNAEALWTDSRCVIPGRTLCGHARRDHGGDWEIAFDRRALTSHKHFHQPCQAFTSARLRAHANFESEVFLRRKRCIEVVLNSWRPLKALRRRLGPPSTGENEDQIRICQWMSG